MVQSAIRRKLLQGGMAAPVVLTISSASASPMSSFGRCLRSGPKQQMPAFFTQQSDGWFRKPVQIAGLSFGGVYRGEFYLDPRLDRYVEIRPPYAMLNFGQLMPPPWRQVSTNVRWALVYFDTDSGAEYRYLTLQQPSGYKPTTISCYGSLRA